MAKQTINIGHPDKGDGDKLRDAFVKVNENFDELYAVTGGGTSYHLGDDIQFVDIDPDSGTVVIQSGFDTGMPVYIKGANCSDGGVGGNVVIEAGGAPLPNTGTTGIVEISGGEVTIEADGGVTTFASNGGAPYVTFPAVGDAQLSIQGGEIFAMPGTGGLALTSYDGNILLSTHGDIAPALVWEFDRSGTLTTPILFPVSFTAVLDVEHRTVGTGTYTGPAWEFNLEWSVAPNGEIGLMGDNGPLPSLVVGYEDGQTFEFTEADHGIPGYTLTIVLSNVVQAGPAGWTANLNFSEPPVYPSTVNSQGAIKITSNENSWIFGTDGNLTLPPGGSIQSQIVPASGTIIYDIPAWSSPGGLSASSFVWYDLPQSLIDLVISGGIIGWTFTPDGTEYLYTVIDAHYGGPNFIEITFHAPLLQTTSSARSPDYSVEQPSSVNLVAEGKTWSFKEDGKLQLPAGGDIVDSTGTSVLGGGGADLGKFIVNGGNILATVDDQVPGAFGGYNINIDPGGESSAGISIPSVSNQQSGGTLQIFNTDSSGGKIMMNTYGGMTISSARGTLGLGLDLEAPGIPNHFHVAFETSNQFIPTADLFFGDDYNYLQLVNSAQGVFIGTNNRTGGNQYQWRFQTDGKFKLPAGGDIVDSNGNSVLGGSSESYFGTVDRFYSVATTFLVNTVNVGANSFTVFGDAVSAIADSNRINVDGFFSIQYSLPILGTPTYDSGTGRTTIVIDDFDGDTVNELWGDHKLRCVEYHYQPYQLAFSEAFTLNSLDGNLVSLKDINTLTNGAKSVSLGSNGVLTLPSNNYIETTDVNLKIGSQGTVTIRSNAQYGETTKSWTFDTDGKLTLPDGAQVYANDTVSLSVGAGVEILHTTYLENESLWELVRDEDAAIIQPDTRPWMGMPSYLAYPEIISYMPPGLLIDPPINLVVIAKTASDAYTAWQEALGNTNVSIGVAGNEWLFESDGTLTFPDSTTQTGKSITLPINQTFDFNLSRSSPPGFTNKISISPGGLTTDGTRLQFQSADSKCWTLNSYQQRIEYSDSTGFIKFGTATKDGTGNSNDIELFSYGQDYVSGAVYISAGSNPTANRWTFNSNGNLTVPGDITTVVTAQIGSILVIPTNYYGTVSGMAGTTIRVAYNADIISMFAVGDTITFQDTTTATILEFNDLGLGFIDILFDPYAVNPALFPVTLTTTDYVAGSTAPANIVVGDNTWSFNSDGRLLLPGGSAEIVVEDGSVRIGTADLLIAPNNQIKIGGDNAFEIFGGPPAYSWSFSNSDSSFNLAGSIKSKAIAQIGQRMTAMDVGGTNLPNKVFGSETFTGGVFTDIQVGWTVSNGEGWTVTVTETDGYGQLTVDGIWDITAIYGRIISFTSPTYVAATAEDLVLTAHNSSLTLSAAGVVSLPNLGGSIKKENYSTVINGPDNSVTITHGLYGDGPGYAGNGVAVAITDEAERIKVGWTCTFSNGPTIFTVTQVDYISNGYQLAFDNYTDNVVFPMVATSPTVSIKLQPVSGGDTWTFGSDGSLELPNGSKLQTYSGGSTGLTSASGGVVEINADGGNETWLFSDTGTLTFPDLTIQTTAFQDVPSHIFFVHPNPGRTFTQTGTYNSPFDTITKAITAAVTAGHSDSDPAVIILMANITENVTLAPGVYLTSLGTGTHGSPTITGTVTVTSSTGNTVSNHYSISNLRIVGPTNGKALYFTGTAPQKLFVRDMWIDAHGTGTGIYMDNTGSGSTLQLDIAHLYHDGSGDIYCIDVVHGNCYVTDIETSGATQVAAVRAGCVLTIDSSELDAVGDVVCETYGSGSVTITNSIINNTQANGNGIKLNDAGGVATLGNNLITVPVGTGYVVQGVSGTFLVAAGNVFTTANTARSTAITYTALPTTWTTKS